MCHVRHSYLVLQCHNHILLSMNQPETAETVYDMLMKNFNRVYKGETDEDGVLQPGNKAPWGLYMHAAWFFGENMWHYDGYRMFLDVCSYYFLSIRTDLLYYRKSLTMRNTLMFLLLM